ncbi:hypothetical protein D4Q71_18960 [Rhodopseudomonas palustris]|nr:hypothetical protein B1S06_24265 [Rhodopseudomonas palustris]RJF61839.1 hypothetical protein D4Q71_18960 [Rhodopseudomonas palustris]
MAEGRLHLDRLSRNACRPTFFPGPVGLLAGQESLPTDILRCAAALKGAASIASGPLITIEAAMGAVLEIASKET